ncbi:phosphoribosylglycinamide formyltransferase [Tenacibaculum sp. Mcav3-52]|uniref:phosphoribosylglycinamide formyltransferase n=1 Tax=unclassified Tenacibaculum TaxID=2635139 RepID=UPI0012E4F681|nr:MULTISPECIES: phosphoribosylglycinamide formyltransferase [unclassified Tenacibaculum]MCG7502557.1 phosphoribosylglycinamide formyltransferase [Tenacibaculum sp. Mcav3-52]MCO7186307.1 phosphoribosylglycinamide formyltransferase [Tenacibaculum sp. XPcli2-G]GFD83409.1 phosphoribosylglycinamide formyltransferase [Tenacibaculum sp. KUL118]
MKEDKKKFAVLISGFGRGAIQLILDSKLGFVKNEFKLIISSKEGSKALEVAEQNKINHRLIKFKDYHNKQEFENEILSVLDYFGIDFIFLAGWNYILTKDFLQKYNKPILNIHPSLLPSFKGAKAITKALEAKVEVTGVTTHFVNENIDEGEIIEQRAIKIEEKDTFEDLDFKIFKAGSELTVSTINKM